MSKRARLSAGWRFARLSLGSRQRDLFEILNEAGDKEENPRIAILPLMDLSGRVMAKRR